MELKELSATDKFFLLWCKDHQEEKYTGVALDAMNLLASYGLAYWRGGLKYDLTSAGYELAIEWDKHLENHQERHFGIFNKIHKLLGEPRRSETPRLRLIG